tara:strand:- start:1530 stop:1811 length:282 start_codon:yes stop_codon:yes gene_type:complete
MPSVNITNSATQIVADNHRQALILQNDSDVDMFIGLNSNVTVASGANAGLRLKAGANFSVHDLGDGSTTVDNTSWYAVHESTGNKILRFLEIE